MAAPGNESKGLQIAVAILATLVVLMGVVSYFLYSSYAETSEKLAAAESQKNEQTQVANRFRQNFEEVRRIAGFTDDDVEKLKDARKQRASELTSRIQSIREQVDAVVTKVQEDARNAQGGEYGRLPEEIEDLKRKARELSDKIESEEEIDQGSQINRLTDLLLNNAQLMAQLARDNINLRRNLSTIDAVNQAGVREIQAALERRSEELVNEQRDADERMRSLRESLTQAQRENTDRARTIDELNTQMREKERKAEEQRLANLETISNLRDELSKTETVLDSPDGTVIYVNVARNEVVLDITRAMGARPQMTMSIFDKRSPGLPTDRPKATVKLVRVGEQNSVATIQRIVDPTDPINPGDLVYSPVWSPNAPVLFALLGKMDLNRDGVDDRDDVRRLIERSGGRVVYDLPPPNARMPESGQLNARVDWYIIDDQEPLRAFAKRVIPTPEDQAFLERQTEIIKEARLYGIRPMPLRRLATYLNYRSNEVDQGVVQYKNEATIESILYPEGRPVPPPGSQPGEDQDDAMSNDEPVAVPGRGFGGRG